MFSFDNFSLLSLLQYVLYFGIFIMACASFWIAGKKLWFPKKLPKDQKINHIKNYLIPNYSAVLGALLLLYFGLTNPESYLAELILYSKSSYLMCFVWGFILILPLFVIEYSKSSFLIGLSLFFVVLITVPGLSLDWLGGEVISGTGGKATGLFLSTSLFYEFKRVRLGNTDWHKKLKKWMKQLD